MKKTFLLPAILPALLLILAAGTVPLRPEYGASPDTWPGKGTGTEKGVAYTYDCPDEPWEESLGNHRAVIRVPRAARSAHLVYHWRRHGESVADHRFLLIDAASGDTVRNVLRRQVDNEVCDIVFGPVEKGTYYFYYLPYTVHYGFGYCQNQYLPAESAPAPDWDAGTPVPAKVRRVEARTVPDSFFPMELPASPAERERYLAAQGGREGRLLVFPEDRKYPAAMRTEIPVRWLRTKQGSGFRGTAAPEEYYAFQVCVWAPDAPVGKLSYRMTDLRRGDDVIRASAVTCFNTEGIGPYGDPVTFDVTVPQGSVQPLWFGVDLPAGLHKGTYKGTLTLQDDAGRTAEVPVALKVKGKPLVARGDDEPWRHSRLRWLNSRLGLGDKPTAPYVPMSYSGDTVRCLGREVAFDRASGAPRQIRAWGRDILSAPLRFSVVAGGKECFAPAEISGLDLTAGALTGQGVSHFQDFDLRFDVRFEFDGWLCTRYTIDPRKELSIDDVRLEIPVKEDVGRYFMGLGLHGQETPRSFTGGWDGPVTTVDAAGRNVPKPEGDDLLWPFDGCWIGRAEAGLQIDFRGASYTGPLLNVYHPAYPDSWYNGGKGRFSIRRTPGTVRLTASGGARTLAAGQPLSFEYAMVITPVKEVPAAARFTDRYYHTGDPATLKPSDDVVASGVRVVNVHHGTPVNPFINYPFLTQDTLSRFTADLHAKDVKVKIYYTARELSNALPEIWALRSLGHEVLSADNGLAPGKGHPWLQEHLEGDYTHQWYHHFDYDVPGHRSADAALLTAEGNSRWFNYYVEGLAWVIRNLDVDGLYIDDVTFDRRILKRMRRAMESVKPGCLIDLHSNTWFSKGPAVQYTEIFPYIDKIWFGESFQYDAMSPACWLVECSGMPFGLPGEMLQDGGNRWLGMQYAMTARLPWSGDSDPRPVWKVWDSFGIADARIRGFWEDAPVAQASDPDVKVTAYVKNGRTLLSIGNYADTPRTVSLRLDWAQLGLDPSRCVLRAPEVDRFQPEASWQVGDRITVAPKRGWLIYVEPR